MRRPVLGGAAPNWKLPFAAIGAAEAEVAVPKPPVGCVFCDPNPLFVAPNAEDAGAPTEGADCEAAAPNPGKPPLFNGADCADCAAAAPNPGNPPLLPPKVGAGGAAGGIACGADPAPKEKPVPFAAEAPLNLLIIPLLLPEFAEPKAGAAAGCGAAAFAEPKVGVAAGCGVAEFAEPKAGAAAGCGAAEFAEPKAGAAAGCGAADLIPPKAGAAAGCGAAELEPKAGVAAGCGAAELVAPNVEVAA